MDRIFYRTDSVDPVSNSPIYIFDTSYLPSTDVISYDAFIPTLISLLPQERYVLVMFSCGLNKISWVWGIKFLKAFLAENNNVENVVKIISVHDSWFIKSITDILTNYNFTKKNIASLNRLFDSFVINSNQPDDVHSILAKSPSDDFNKNTIIRCNSLSQLSNYVDIRRLKISLNVYKHDLEVENDIQLSIRFIPLLNPYTRIDRSSHPLFFHHFYQVFNIINANGEKVELLFHKPGNKANTEIFYNCVNRNQLIWINDWNLFCISTAFKKFLHNLPYPMVPLDSIELPIKDDFNYTFTTFSKIIAAHEYNEETTNYSNVLIQLCRLCHGLINANQVTKHTSTSLAKCMSHCLSHQLVSNSSKDVIIVVTRFLRNVLEFWPQISTAYKNYPSIEDIINGKVCPIDKPDDSYDLSYDVTLEEDDENDKKFNSIEILATNRQSIAGSEGPVDKLITPRTSPRRINLPATPSSLSPHKPRSPVRSPKREKLYSPNKPAKSVNFSMRVANKLADVSNIGLQFPPQKYKFSANARKEIDSTPAFLQDTEVVVKKPVIRGRKVGELAKLFEERSQALELLKGM
ncbi:hypothetical protein G9P44_001249 [Scheffersomyces stipitis]|nr:hypothetical protein G9P44_001249 [Scheffersomyces stipitis]